MAALAVRLRELGAEVRVCAPPDEEFVELLAGAGVPLMPFGRAWRSWERPSTAEERSRRVAEFIAAQYDTVAAAAAGCDVLLATGMSHFVAGSVAEKLAIPHGYATFAPILLDSLFAQDWNALFSPPVNVHRTSIGLSPVDDVREFMFTDHLWLAADPTLGPWQGTPALDVVHTGAWILPDERPLPADLVAFLDAGTPPVYVGFGSMRGVAKDVSRVTIEAVRAQGRRVLVARGWADLALIDDRDDCFAVGEVNQQALFGRVAAVVHHGGAGTTTTAARAGDTAGRHAPGGCRPGLLGLPAGRPGHRRGTPRSGSDHRVPVSRAQDGPDPPDPRTGGRRGRRDPHRRGDGGRDDAGRRGQP